MKFSNISHHRLIESLNSKKKEKTFEIEKQRISAIHLFDTIRINKLNSQ